MKIAHVIDSMDVGGAEMIVLSLVELHRAEGNELSVHCLFESGVLGRKLASDGVPVRVHGLTSGKKLVRSLYRAFKEERPDIVHCHNAFASMVGAVAGRFAGSRVISTRHGLIPTPRRSRHARFWLSARCMERVVAVCDTARINLSKAPFAQKSKLVTIFNGSQPAVALSPRRDEQAFTGVMVARLAPPKDHATALRALALARRQVPNARLSIVGGGPHERQLRQLATEFGIAEAVDFHGERHDVGNFLAGADYFLLASRSEGVPVSMLEAMSAGLPMIVSSVGGMPEIIAMSQAGTVTPPGDAEALAGEIAALAHDPKRGDELRRRATLAYAKYFTTERMAAEYMSLYKSCEAKPDAAPEQRIRERRLRFIRRYSKWEQAIVPGLRSSQYEYKDKLLGLVNEKTRWLDLGCGHGMFGTWMRRDEEEVLRKKPMLFGVDRDFGNLRLNGLVANRVLADIEQLPFTPESFDVISANMVVEHLSSPEVALAAISRLLRPGGVFLFHTTNARHYLTPLSSLFRQGFKNRIIRFLEGRTPEDVFPTYYRINSSGRIRALAQQAGLELVDLKFVNSTAETFMLGPVVILELLITKLLNLRWFEHYRSNVVAVLRKGEVAAGVSRTPRLTAVGSR